MSGKRYGRQARKLSKTKSSSVVPEAPFRPRNSVIGIPDGRPAKDRVSVDTVFASDGWLLSGQRVEAERIQPCGSAAVLSHPPSETQMSRHPEPPKGHKTTLINGVTSPHTPPPQGDETASRGQQWPKRGWRVFLSEELLRCESQVQTWDPGSGRHLTHIVLLTVIPLPGSLRTALFFTTTGSAPRCRVGTRPGSTGSGFSACGAPPYRQCLAMPCDDQAGVVHAHHPDQCCIELFAWGFDELLTLISYDMLSIVSPFSKAASRKYVVGSNGVESCSMLCIHTPFFS